MMTLNATGLLDPFTGEFSRLAAVELLLLGVACGALGAWVVQLGRAFFAESLAHALLPGLVAGAAAGTGLTGGALLGTGAAYGAESAAQRAPRTTPSTATAISVTTLVAIGALLATQVEGAGLLERLLFGDPLGASGADVAAGASLTLLVAAATWLLRRPLMAWAFEPHAQAPLGLSARALELAFLAVLSLTVAVAAFVAGSLLAPALMTGPALGVRALNVHASRAPVAAGALGGACGLAGVYASYAADLPVSACVALACAVSALVPALARSTGSTSRRHRRSSPG